MIVKFTIIILISFSSWHELWNGTAEVIAMHHVTTYARYWREILGFYLPVLYVFLFLLIFFFLLKLQALGSMDKISDGFNVRNTRVAGWQRCCCRCRQWHHDKVHFSQVPTAMRANSRGEKLIGDILSTNIQQSYYTFEAPQIEWFLLITYHIS